MSESWNLAHGVAGGNLHEDFHKNPERERTGRLLRGVPNLRFPRIVEEIVPVPGQGGKARWGVHATERDCQPLFFNTPAVFLELGVCSGIFVGDGLLRRLVGERPVVLAKVI